MSDIPEDVIPDGTPDGLTARLSTLTSARKAAEARAVAAEAALGTATEAHTTLTKSHAELASQYEASQGKYATLEGLVDAGLTKPADRKLATFWHADSGSELPITEWVGTLTAETAPQGLGGLFSTPSAPAAAPPADPAAPPAPKLPDSNGGVKPPPVPNGSPSGEQIRNMSDAEYAEYRKRLPGRGHGRR